MVLYIYSLVIGKASSPMEGVVYPTGTAIITTDLHLSCLPGIPHMLSLQTRSNGSTGSDSLID